MKPFCDYNFADYWSHWLSFEDRADDLPDIYHVNWSRQDANGRFLWPGFGENLRVLRWIIDRCEGRVGARSTPISLLPHAEDIDTAGLDISGTTLESLLVVGSGKWRDEMDEFGEYLNAYGERLPDRLKEQHQAVREALAG